MKILGPGSVIWDLIFEIWANLVTLLTPKESFDPQIESTRNPWSLEAFWKKSAYALQFLWAPSKASYLHITVLPF